MGQAWLRQRLKVIRFGTWLRAVTRETRAFPCGSGSSRSGGWMASCYGYISRAFAAANQVRIPVLGNASVARPSTITTERSEGRQVIPGINTDIWESALKQSVHRLPITGSPRKGNAADPLQAFSQAFFRYGCIFHIVVGLCCVCYSLLLSL